MCTYAYEPFTEVRDLEEKVCIFIRSKTAVAAVGLKRFTSTSTMVGVLGEGSETNRLHNNVALL